VNVDDVVSLLCLWLIARSMSQSVTHGSLTFWVCPK